MPLLASAYRARHGRVEFVGIDANDTAGAARAFLTRVHVAYPVVSDPGGAVAAAYQLFGLPTTIFISPRGTIIGRHIGELSPSMLTEALATAFHD
jgi:hypothetical protein